jgi:hypothetical protein
MTQEEHRALTIKEMPAIRPDAGIIRRIKAALPVPWALADANGEDTDSRAWTVLADCGHELLLVGARRPKAGDYCSCRRCASDAALGLA